MTSGMRGIGDLLGTSKEEISDGQKQLLSNSQRGFFLREDWLMQLSSSTATIKGLSACLIVATAEIFTLI